MPTTAASIGQSFMPAAIRAELPLTMRTVSPTPASTVSTATRYAPSDLPCGSIGRATSSLLLTSRGSFRVATTVPTTRARIIAALGSYALPAGTLVLPMGSASSRLACGRGMTCTETSSPTRRAAAAPASVAAFTAATSPRTIAVTYPAPIFSQPTSVTFAALTIASAASIIATRPLVSTIPNASPIYQLPTSKDQRPTQDQRRTQLVSKVLDCV